MSASTLGDRGPVILCDSMRLETSPKAFHRSSVLLSCAPLSLGVILASGISRDWTQRPSFRLCRPLPRQAKLGRAVVVRMSPCLQRGRLYTDRPRKTTTTLHERSAAGLREAFVPLVRYVLLYGFGVETNS